MSITGELNVRWNITQIGPNALGGQQFNPNIDQLIRIAAGTGLNQADIHWGGVRTLAPSANESLDLAGVLTDAFGTVVAAAKLVALLVIADSANTNDVVLGAAASFPIPLFGGTAGTFAVKPGGWFFVAAPGAAGQLTVTPATADLLRVANSGAGTSVTYRIILLARSV